MPRCNCNSACNCVVQAGDGITVTGNGSSVNPYIVTGSGGADVHDGVGAGSTFILLSANSPSATGIDSVAMGINAVATGDSSTAIGSGAEVDNNSGTAIGDSAWTQSVGSIALGLSAHAFSIDSIAIGHSAHALNFDNAIAIGSSAVASGTNSIAIGANASVPNPINDGIAIGNTALASSVRAIAIGYLTQSTHQGNVALGEAALATGNNAAIAIGRNAAASHNDAVALGGGVSTTNTFQVNIGTKRFFAGGATTAPANGDLINSQWSAWIDETGNNLTFKVKYNGGTVKNGTVALV